jgi:hypothetical protein
MKTSTIILILAFIVLIESFSACSDNPANNINADLGNQTANSNENANLAKDNTENLKVIIKMPFEPEETVWREDAMNQRNSENRDFSAIDKKLTAALRFSAEDADKIAAQAETYGQPLPAEIGTEDWFPAELIAQSELSGNETLKGIGYAATDFSQPPFIDGRLTRIENSNYFILELYTK